MKTTVFLFLFLLIPRICFGAELLVKASGHWKDAWLIEEVANLTGVELRQYNARTQIGDIICVRPDGWTWGNAECLPDYIVVKLPGISVDTVKHYEDLLFEVHPDPINATDLKVLKRRKHRIPKTWIENYKTQDQSIITISVSGQQQALRNSVIIKTE